jgi:large subunit ribosomal protein L47
MFQGRAWEASELRLKNFKDLHTLWYVAAREQNLLATQKEEVRRMGVTMNEMQVPMEKVRNVRETLLCEFVFTLLLRH